MEEQVKNNYEIKRVNYEQIKKANDEIIKMKVGSGDYAKVSERVNAFRKVYPTGAIETIIEVVTDTQVRIKAVVLNEEKELLSTARATEEKKVKGKMTINLTDMIENCETSAVGRALGFAGFGIDNDIASGEDIEKAKSNGKMFQIYENMYISDDEAKYIAKTVVADLMRKMGVVKAHLEEIIYEKLWTKLESLSTNQFLKLESQLKTLNMENNPWKELYNENVKIKDVVPKEQEVMYEISTYKYGKLALEKAGTDELLRSDLINWYLDRGVDLS